jgi:GGDEF domain-containing protein
MARAKRYNLSFSVLCFSVVETQSQKKPHPHGMAEQALVEAVLNKLAVILREADVLGQLEKGRMVALLPMTDAKQARLVLRRCLKVLRTEPVLVDGIPLTPKIAGIAYGFDPSMKADVDAFVQAMSNELEHMISRVKNINMFL